eukprot:TRINITY_DN3676_c0_g1_i1.p1 TRINITY_DN3676_c0_g1~~TRINITY_DN3676_c0_g1_i1.p1  ORF type:complete len:109 (+),score=22.30 TRINITY_DN3676_c0_g1_i1:85-411(+)
MEAYKKIYPEEFYRKFLVHHTRPDGRGLTAIRKTVVTAGSITSAHGSAFVKIGSTSVVCGIKGEVGKKTSGKHMGWFSILFNFFRFFFLFFVTVTSFTTRVCVARTFV